MVKFMEEKKTSSLNFLLIFFLSYSFYTIQILTQELFYLYSKQSVPIICAFFILFPLITFIICKMINKNKIKNNTKNNFVFSIFTSIYLILTTIISIINIANIIMIYYYQQTSIIILLIFLVLPIIYIIIKGENNFFSLASVLLIIYIIFKYAYIKNYPSIDIYTFHNILKIDKSNIFTLIMLSLPILIEPIILLNNQKDMSDKINIKLITAISILLSLVGIITILRQTWEFGNLLGQMRFPYLESIKNNQLIRDFIVFFGMLIMAILSGCRLVVSLGTSAIAVCLVYGFGIIKRNAIKKQILQDLLNVSECLRVQISSQIPLNNSLRSIPELCINKEFSNLLKNVYLEYELSKFIIVDSGEALQLKFNYPEMKLFLSALNQQIQGTSAIDAFDNVILLLREKYIEFLEDSTKSKMAIMTIGVFGIVLNIAAMGVYPMAVEAFNAINVMLK